MNRRGKQSYRARQPFERAKLARFHHANDTATELQPGLDLDCIQKSDSSLFLFASQWQRQSKLNHRESAIFVISNDRGIFL